MKLQLLNVSAYQAFLDNSIMKQNEVMKLYIEVRIVTNTNS